MKLISLIMLKPYSLDNSVEKDLLQEISSKKLDIYFKKDVYVSKEKLLNSQPSLTNGKYNKDDCEKILNNSIGTSRFFLVVGDENIFRELKEIKWKIRNKYSNLSKGIIGKSYVHSSEDYKELLNDVSTFLPEKLPLIKNVDERFTKYCSCNVIAK